MDDLGALLRYHRYRAGSFYLIGSFLFGMLLIPAVAFPGELWQRMLLIAGGLALASPFFVHALRRRHHEIGIFEEAIVFRTGTETKIVRWENVKSLDAEGVRPPAVRMWMVTKSGDRLLVNGGPVGYENVDFLVREIERRIANR
jgi:hypothetical protein